MTNDTPPRDDAPSRECSMVIMRRSEDGTPTVWCDPEIVDLIDALNNEQISTIASCSGHGHRPGWIAMNDGRHLMVFDDFDTFKKVSEGFPIDINGNRRADQPARVGVSKTDISHLEYAIKLGWKNGSESMAEGLERILAALLPTEAGAEPVAIPRYPTEAMMDAGLYHAGEASYSDLLTAWTAMFDAVALDGGTSDSLPAATPPTASPNAALTVWEIMDALREFTWDDEDFLLEVEAVMQRRAAALSPQRHDSPTAGSGRDQGGEG